MRGKLGDKIRLQHMYDAIVEIESYTNNVDLSDFINNSMMRFACLKQLEIIGEASNHISEETQHKFPDIEWKQIVGMRNVFVHEYFGIDSILVWEIIQNDIAELKNKIKEIVENL
jgi:uncharacterized protein with HEPN domain